MKDEAAYIKSLRRTLYRKSLYDFVKDFWNTCDPSNFIGGKIVRYYCEVFQYFCNKWVKCEEIDVDVSHIPHNETVVDIRQGKQNLCLNVPPRHTKSMIFNVFGPVWLWLSAPIKAVSISHTGGLATEMNRKRKMIINSDKFRFFFPEIVLLTDTSSFLLNSKGGELRSLNKNSFTGYGGDIIINDDLTNAETARKDAMEMDNTWHYYKNTMPSRINDISKCIIMNIQQRLAPNDVTGHIIEEEALAKTYVFIVMPARFDKTTHFICPISGEILTWEKGEFLWPERFDDYESLRAQVGESVFATQYLQNPIASDKTIIKDAYIRRKKATECPKIEDADIIYASHDFPVKDKDTSDFLGSVLAYKVGSTLYIKDCLEKHMAFTDSVEYVKNLDTHYPGIIQIIEDKANGSPILQQLQDEIPGLQAYQPGTNSKTQRLESASLYMNSGNVVFVEDRYDEMTSTYSYTQAVSNLVTRLLNFPFIEHDDIVDAFSQLLLFVYMDRRYMVYGRSFNDANYYEELPAAATSGAIFFNKEGDLWKICDIRVLYGETTKLYVDRENTFKASNKDGFAELRKFAPKTKVFIDCSDTEALYGLSDGNVYIERYAESDFDRSVGKLNLAFSKKLILVNRNCHRTKNDIENFKFSKTKDENVKYISEKDGMVACLRIAIAYFGGII